MLSTTMVFPAPPFMAPTVTTHAGFFWTSAPWPLPFPASLIDRELKNLNTREHE